MLQYHFQYFREEGFNKTQQNMFSMSIIFGLTKKPMFQFVFFHYQSGDDLSKPKIVHSCPESWGELFCEFMKGFEEWEINEIMHNVPTFSHDLDKLMETYDHENALYEVSQEKR